jgi:uncharacterized protein YbaP (TraB family)
MKKPMIFFLCAALIFSASAQKPATSYQSLLWEISGNGLQQSSYLFGTMHVSNKMVFHLSDSFYHALASCSMVSLEVDPKQWQPEMFRVQQSQMAMFNYSGRAENDFMREKSFQVNNNYEDNIKIALSEEPMQVNSLLYRSYAGQTDFQENTYLDLYIYQTGRKLGKKATGVENYIESEKLMLEASEDMAKETRKIRINDGENLFDVQKKLQDAYRRGDLDLMDSLSKLMSVSEAFDEKFLYKRNEIQANSIDSIIQKATLFVGVGAAHLPGNRGVIELLRRKGYTLRPVRMSDQDAEQREKIDKMRVPVVMKPFSTADGFIQLQVPGPLFKRIESAANESWQYADMENGSYYMLTRIRTHAGMLGQQEEEVLKRIDSILYESIPGKIIQKTKITKDGYKGFDITNKTRRGDIQRYNVIITPAEVLVFKMSGNDDYVQGKEADNFFASVHIKEAANQWADYTPAAGGFTVAFPQYPDINKLTGLEDRLDTWQYEASDRASGDAYMIIQKSIQNYRFLEEDTLDLHLIEESIKSADIIKNESSRKYSSLNGYPCLDISFSLKEGGTVNARAVIKGSQYYLLLAKTKDDSSHTTRFLNSFHFSPLKYGPSMPYYDSALHFSVNTPVKPLIDKDLQSYIERSMYNPVIMRRDETYQSETQTRNACFKSDSTGETVQVTVSTLPEYFYRKETDKFWENEMHWKKLEEDFILQKKEFANKHDSLLGYTYTLLDTNSNRKVKGMAIVKGNTIYKLSALIDNLSAESSFIKDFFASFTPTVTGNGYTVFTSKAPLFFERYASRDSLTKKIAQAAVSHIIFEGSDLEKIKRLITRLKPLHHNYIDHKTKLILAIGRIKDTANMSHRVAYLQEIRNNCADTGSLENAAIMALATTKSKEAYSALKNLLIKNPAIFETNAEYNELFARMRDSLALAKTLFPGILQLASLDDYKIPLNNLLYLLVDSGYIKSNDYEDHFASIFFDAQVQLKKLQGRNEREAANANNDDMNRQFGEIVRPTQANNATNTRLTNYATLLMPFYDKNISVTKFFNKLLQGSDVQVKMTTALLLIKNNKPVSDSVLTAIAANERYRATLFEKLEKIKKEGLFPATFKTQEAMARSLLLNATSFDKFSEIEMAGKEYAEDKDTKGYIYFFKYKLQKKGDWLMGIAGIQPKEADQVNSNHSLINATNKKIRNDETTQEQFEKKAQQLLLAKRKSAAQFYMERSFGGGQMLF